MRRIYDFISFHGDKAIKKKYVDRVIMHQKADHLIHGNGWLPDLQKGCAVGCTLEAYDHSRYPVELGIPEWLARVEDTLFEGMSLDKSKTWPEKFLKAIPVGVDLEKIKVKFLIVVLEDSLVSMKRVKFDKKANPQVVAALKGSKIAVELMIKAHKSGDAEKINAAADAADAAGSAADAADAAGSAARSARSAAAYAARSAADAAGNAAYAAAFAADAAGSAAAWAAGSAAYAAGNAADAAFDNYADELLKILKHAK